jgi:hypothetical protein
VFAVTNSRVPSARPSAEPSSPVKLAIAPPLPSAGGMLDRGEACRLATIRVARRIAAPSWQ